MMRQGVVTRIDRTNNLVYAILHDGASISAAYITRRRAPWPLSTASFVQRDGSWVCLGPVGDSRLLVADNFTTVTSPNGDTPWVLTTAGTGGNFASVSVADAQGVGRLRELAGAGAVSITKDARAFTIPTGGSTAGIWVSTRVALSVLPTAVDTGASGGPVLCGLMRNTTAFKEGWSIDNGSDNFYFGGRGSSFSAGGAPVAVDTFAWLDLIHAEGFLAGWVDGDGPYALFGTSSELAPTLGIGRVSATPSSASAVQLDISIDVCSAWVVGFVNDPAAFASAASSR